MSKRYHVGVIRGRREVFFTADPNQQSIRETYDYVIGPFRTQLGAFVMRNSGDSPTVNTVAAAERIARQIRSDMDHKRA